MKKRIIVLMSVIFVLILWGCRTATRPNTPTDATNMTETIAPTEVSEATETTAATAETTAPETTAPETTSEATKPTETTAATTATKPTETTAATKATTATTATKATVATTATSPDKEAQCTHYWSQWTETVFATCQTVGQKERTCRLCGAAETKTTPQTDHKKSDWLLGKPADVGVTGTLYMECVYCKVQLKTQTIPAITNSHTHAIANWVTVKKPDCTHTGLKNALCSCGKIMESQETPVSHSPFTDLGEPATCFITGLTEGQHCLVCNEVLIPQKVIEKLPHTPEIEEAVPATCTDYGCTEAIHCSVCLEYIVKPQSIAPKGHSMSSKFIDSADESERYTLHYCTVCSYSYKEYDLPPSPVTFKSNGDGTCKVVGLTNGPVENLVIPGRSSNGDIVVSIGNSALTAKGIKTVTIPDTVEEIESYAFRYNDTLETVHFSKNLKKIQPGAFERCYKLRDVVLPEGLQILGYFAFTECTSLTAITIPKTVTSVGDNCFNSCTALASVTLDAKLTSISNSLFYGCTALKNITLPNTVTVISENAFSGSGLTSITLPDSCTGISTHAFTACKSLASITFGKNFKTIGSYAFNGCTSLKSIKLPAGFQKIGDWAFNNCTSLESIYLGQSLTEIGSAAFRNCTSLTHMFLPKTLLSMKPESYDQSPFTGCSGSLDLYTDADRTNTNWDRYFGRTSCGVSYEEYLQITA